MECVDLEPMEYSQIRLSFTLKGDIDDGSISKSRVYELEIGIFTQDEDKLLDSGLAIILIKEVAFYESTDFYLGLVTMGAIVAGVMVIKIIRQRRKKVTNNP